RGHRVSRPSSAPGTWVRLAERAPSFGRDRQHGVRGVADQPASVGSSAGLQACLRAYRESRLYLRRDPAHGRRASRVVCLGRRRRGQYLLGQPLGLGADEAWTMTLTQKLLVSVGALSLAILLWRIDLGLVKLALSHVGWGMV